MSKFQRATRAKTRARVSIDGPAKAGKSFTALRLALSLGGKIAAIDTEFGSLSKYAGAKTDDGEIQFDVIELHDFKPENYVEMIHEAETSGYDVLVIDSLSHAWVGEGGILDQADKMKARGGGGNSFQNWAHLTPQHRKLIDAMLSAKLHIIATMRSKTEYVMEANAAGKMVPRKVGLAPVQRDQMEYEFDLLVTMDSDHNCIISGSRCPGMDGKVSNKPGAAFFRPYVEWLTSGIEPPPAVAAVDANRKLVAKAIREAKESGNYTDEGYRELLSQFDVVKTADLNASQLHELASMLAAAGRGDAWEEQGIPPAFSEKR